MVYKENSKEIALRKILPIYKNDNTYKQVDDIPINTNVKEIKSNNKIYNKNNTKDFKYKSDRDYSNFDWNSLYANNF